MSIDSRLYSNNWKELALTAKVGLSAIALGEDG